ncbi:type II toxin-antitoxin system HicA family toxin [Nocardia pseudovaccinii]|uniref:type II toxin-antitoxin system HicA family toxin n=1 Tax=Nocardia pseudovaccinii TaxID=189540 RepID=UPI0007A3AB04
MPPVPAVRGDNVVRALERAGFKQDRVRGSDYVMRHPDGRQVSGSPRSSGMNVEKLLDLF